MDVNSNKKIAFVVRLFQLKEFYAGGEKFVYKTIGEFIKKGYSVDIWCEESDAREAQGISEIVFYKKPDDSLSYEEKEPLYREICRQVDEKGYDFSIYDGVVPFAANLILQVYSRKYSPNSLLCKIYYKLKPQKLKHILYEKKCLEQKRNRIIAVSENLKKDLLSKFDIPESKISVVYPGIDEGDLATRERISSKALKDFRFGVSATFFKRKGGWVFLFALIVAKLMGNDLKALIILRNTSNQKIFRKLLRLFSIEKNVEFIGFQKDMKEFYGKIDCLTMPSVEEAFGLVALEAMAAGVPVIVSDCSGIAEILTHKKDALIFKMDFLSSVWLAKEMIWLKKNPSEALEISKKAREKAKNHLWARTAHEIETAVLTELNINIGV